MTTFLLRAFCPDCMTELVPVTSAANPCREPKAEANCPGCNRTFCVSASVEECYGIPRDTFDPEAAAGCGSVQLGLRGKDVRNMRRLLIAMVGALVLTFGWWHQTHTPVTLVYRNQAGQIVGHPHFDTTVETVHFAGSCTSCVEWRVYVDDNHGGYWTRYRGPASAMPAGAVLIGDLP